MSRERFDAGFSFRGRRYNDYLLPLFYNEFMRGFIFILFLFLALPGTADTYIRLGFGSAIMSAIIGFFVAIGLTIKSCWYIIKSIFSKL